MGLFGLNFALVAVCGLQPRVGRMAVGGARAGPALASVETAAKAAWLARLSQPPSWLKRSGGGLTPPPPPPSPSDSPSFSRSFDGSEAAAYSPAPSAASPLPFGAAQAAKEQAAKEAWLARLEEPSWPRQGRAARTALPSLPPPPEGWLLPGSPVLSLAAADAMSSAALAEAGSRGFNPVSVCVMDAAGRILVTKTMLGCGRLTPDLAIAKASACVGLLCSSRELRDRYVNEEGTGPKMPQLLACGTIAAMNNQAIAPFPGGVLCRDDSGNVVGAIGVSGAASDEDEHCAILAAKALGLETEPTSSRLA